MSNFNDLIFKLKNILFRQRAVKQYKDAIYNCTMTDEQLHHLNWGKRKTIVAHAYNHTVFYRKYYDSVGFHPDMLITEKDWEKIPILEKEMVREFQEEIKDSNANTKYFGIATTGGSTGLPLKIYTDKRFNNEILGWRAFKWWNISPAANVGIIHRRVPVTTLRKFLNRFLWWPTKRIYLNASSISDENLRNFVYSIQKNKIEWLQGYVGALERVAEYILRNNITINTLNLVWSTSAPLYKNVRTKFEKAFNCKIMNQYGCSEVANIAIQCSVGENLHINYDYVHVDVISDNQYCINREGDILITNLYSYVFPLIKYRLGDKGAILKDKCPCGNNLPLLAEIKGRISDAVYTPDGLYIDGSYLTTVFDNYVKSIEQFQIHQKIDHSVVVYVKLYQQNKEALNTLAAVKQILEKNVKNKIPVTIEIVDNIEDDRGKIRYIISDIALSKIQKNIHD
jgi:phenylacetate-CoA ligase